MEIKLRDYQEEDVQFLVRHQGGVNANDPGLGKTLEVLTAIHRVDAKQVLIICPTIAAGVWKMEAKKWYNWDSTIMQGTTKQREKLWKEYLANPTRLLIITSKKILETVEHKAIWDWIVADEIHSIGLLNHKTKTFKDFKQLISPRSPILMTGTPIRRDLSDLYAPLHLLAPKVFKSYWQFRAQWCNILEGPYGKQVLKKPKNPVAFKNMISNYIIRHKKEDVLKDLPLKTRQVIPIDLPKKLQKMHDDMLLDLMMDVNEEDTLVAQNIMVATLRLRQLLVCPRILGVDDDGPALTALVEDLIPEEFAAGRSIVITTVYKEAVQYIKQAIMKHSKALNDPVVYTITGDNSSQAAEIAEMYQKNPKKEKIIIFTVQTGASWTAHKASTAFFLGCSWSVGENIQAEDRIHRIGQEQPVFIKYLLHNNTVDEAVMQRLEENTLGMNWALNPEEVLEKIARVREQNK